jgi:hypothetical protein
LSGLYGLCGLCNIDRGTVCVRLCTSVYVCVRHHYPPLYSNGHTKCIVASANASCPRSRRHLAQPSSQPPATISTHPRETLHIFTLSGNHTLYPLYQPWLVHVVSADLQKFLLEAGHSLTLAAFPSKLIATLTARQTRSATYSRVRTVVE